jgi:biotin-[acetyl-CoA-carboxylase] ligase BirA-like protein
VTFGTPIVHYELCDSTQNIALEKLKTGSPPGTTITADAMTNGRGRSGRAWHTPERSNVCLTTIGESVAPEILWQLAPLVSLACVEALRALSHLAIHIRFPNDIYLENKKLGGILIESSVLEHQTYPLIGIGKSSSKQFSPSSPSAGINGARAASSRSAQATTSILPPTSHANLAISSPPSRRYTQMEPIAFCGKTDEEKSKTSVSSICDLPKQYWQ